MEALELERPQRQVGHRIDQRTIGDVDPARRHRIGLGRNDVLGDRRARSEEHTSELQSLMRISYAVFCLKKKNNKTKRTKLHIKSYIMTTNKHTTYTNIGQH